MSKKNLVACGKTKSSTITTTTPKIMSKRRYRRKKHFEHDFIMEEILTKVPAFTLLQCGAVSKRWYQSIHIDKRLTYAHFLHTQKQPNLIFNLFNIRVGVDTQTSEFFRLGSGILDHANILKYEKLSAGFSHGPRMELVGYCNGLPCVLLQNRNRPFYQILQPTNADYVCIYCPNTIGGEYISVDQIICHGFGFDSLASEYKLLTILRSSPKQLNFVVYTLGTKSWRNVTISMPISYHCTHPVIRLRAATSSDKSGIFCSSSGGCLVWMITATTATEEQEHNNVDDNHNNNEMEMEMLLLFNLHEEKFQLMQIPTKSTNEDEQQKKLLFVDYPHLLEFKGYPCIARLEKRLGNGSDDYCHRRCLEHHGSSSCCCCCKVHLYVLKDNVRQVWLKEESIDVHMNSHPLNYFAITILDACCFHFGSTASMPLPPTRIFCFSDQILLYWFAGTKLQVYNLRYKKLDLVVPCSETMDLFHAKMEEASRDIPADEICYSNKDYQLHCQGENFVSTQTFVPKGVARVDEDDFEKLTSNTYSAYVFVNKCSGYYYPF